MSDPAAVELADLADSVLREVIEVRRRYEDLERLLGSIESSASDSTAARGAAEEEPPLVSALGGNSKPDLGAVRSIARTAALSGATRDEVEAYLRHELDVADPRTALDEVFGSDAPPRR